MQITRGVVDGHEISLHAFTNVWLIADALTEILWNSAFWTYDRQYGQN
jgi:hypothetical protein